MTSRNTAHPNVAFVVTEQGTSETVARLKGQFAGLASSLQKNLTDVNSSLRDRMVATATDIDNHWKAQLAKIAPNLVRGNWSATREKTLLDISEITRALGDLKTAQTAIAMHDMSLAMNAGRLVSDLREASNLMSSMGRGFAGDSGGIISGLSGFQARQQSATTAAAQQLIAQESASKIALLRSGRFGAHDSGGIISGLSAYQASSGRSDRIRRAHELANNASIHADNELGDADFAASSQRKTAMLRRMAGLAGSHVTSGSQWEDQMLGGVIRTRAERHAATDMADPDVRARTTQSIVDTARSQGSSTYRLANNGSIVRSDAANLRRSASALGLNDLDLGADYQGMGGGGRRQWYGPDHENRGWTGRLSSMNSNRFRFAAQNVGFGVDDAIQSYQFGGAKASIRAASNNVTAIAGMLISSPIIAAASVIAISAASAALPAIMDKFGLRDRLQKMGRSDREAFRDSDQGGYSNALGLDYYTENQERYRKKAISYQSGASKDLYSAISSDTFGSDFSDRLLGLSDMEDQRRGNLSSQEGMQQRKMQERSRRYEEVQKSSVFNPGNWYMQFQSVSGTYKTQLTEDIDKALDELDKENISLQDKIEVQRSLLAEGRKRLDANRKMRRGNFLEDRGISDASMRGDLTVSQLQDHYRKRAEQQVKLADETLTGTKLEARKEQVKHDLAERMLNPEEDQRRLDMARSQSAASRHSYYYGVSGDTSRVSSEHSTATSRNAQLNQQHISGHISTAQYQDRLAASQVAWQRNRQLAAEDDIEELNPEINPLKRMSLTLSRRMQQLSLRENLSPEEMRLQALAVLKKGERDKIDFHPQGHHKFISHGYRVDSAEDAEIEARATGNFGPVSHPGKHDSKTLQEILAAIVELNQNLQFEAQRLGT